MELTGFAYLAALLASIAGIAIIDWRWRLFVAVDHVRALVVLAVGVLFFSLWDAVGIATGLFFRGETPYMTGWLIAPDFPVEELFFLLLLCWTTMVAWQAGARLRGGRR